MGENDSIWPVIKALIDQYPKEIIDFQYKTEFTEKEMKDAEFFMIHPSWHFEYPQPEDDFGFKKTTYDPRNYCPECGIGLIQKAPFSLKKAPKWGTRNILQVNWVFSEYFVSEDLKNDIEKAGFKLQFMPVLKYPIGMELKDISQLVISDQINLEMPQYAEYQICKVCHRKKYLPLTKGFSPKPNSNNFMIAHSEQNFGSGHSAFQEVFINKDVYHLFTKIKVKGATFVPCEL